MHPEVDFRGLTPNRNWEAKNRDAVISYLLASGSRTRTRSKDSKGLESDAFADRQRVGYRFSVTNPDGRFLVEQQAYLSAPDGQIEWMRVLCSGFRPAGYARDRVRRCRDDERQAIVAIVNAAAEAYRGVILPIAGTSRTCRRRAGRRDRRGSGVLGLRGRRGAAGNHGHSARRDVDLIRHAYVSPASQRRGVGSALLDQLAARPRGECWWAPGQRPIGRSSSTAATGSSRSHPS